MTILFCKKTSSTAAGNNGRAGAKRTAGLNINTGKRHGHVHYKLSKPVSGQDISDFLHSQPALVILKRKPKLFNTRATVIKEGFPCGDKAVYNPFRSSFISFAILVMPFERAIWPIVQQLWGSTLIVGLKYQTT